VSWRDTKKNREYLADVAQNVNLQVSSLPRGHLLPNGIVYCQACGRTRSTELDSLEVFRKLMGFVEARGRHLDTSPGSIFKSPDLGNFELLGALPGTPPGETLAADVRKLLGWSEQDSRSPGAYPLRP